MKPMKIVKHSETAEMLLLVLSKVSRELTRLEEGTVPFESSDWRSSGTTAIED